MVGGIGFIWIRIGASGGLLWTWELQAFQVHSRYKEVFGQIKRWKSENIFWVFFWVFIGLCIKLKINFEKSSVSCPSRFIPCQSAPETRWTENQRDWRSEENRAITFPCRSSNHETSVVDPYRSNYNNWAISAPTKSRQVDDRQEHELSHTGTYLLTYSLHGAESFLSSWLACS